MSATEAIEARNTLRAHIAEIDYGLNLKKDKGDLARVPMVHEVVARPVAEAILRAGRSKALAGHRGYTRATR